MNLQIDTNLTFSQSTIKNFGHAIALLYHKVVSWPHHFLADISIPLMPSSTFCLFQSLKCCPTILLTQFFNNNTFLQNERLI